MNINIFNDCKNESLFVDGQYLFQITFIDRSSSLLDSILAKYPTDRVRLERVWDRLRAGQPTSDHVSLAYLMVLNGMLLEAGNYLKLSIRKFKRGKPSATDSELQNFVVELIRRIELALATANKLSGTQAALFSQISKHYSTKFNKGAGSPFGATYTSLFGRDNVLRSISRHPLQLNRHTVCSANNFTKARFFDPQHPATYMVATLQDARGEPLLSVIDLLPDTGETPPEAKSVNTFVFPTTIAPIVDFNSPDEDPKPMPSLSENLREVKQIAGEIEQGYRISALGDLTNTARRDLFRSVEQIVDSARSSGEMPALASTLSARLEADIDEISKDPSSPYFGMSPKNVRVGFLSKLLGSNGYAELAVDVDLAITQGIRIIKHETNCANFANNIKLVTEQYTQQQHNEFLGNSNNIIKDTTQQINDLISFGSYIFEIDQEALVKRGFSPSFKPIQLPPTSGARENPLSVLGKYTLVLTGFATLVTAVYLAIRNIDVNQKIAHKNTLLQVRGLMRKLLLTLRTSLATLDSQGLSSARQQLRVYSDSIQNMVISLLAVLTAENTNLLVTQEIGHLKSLYEQVISIANNTTIDKAEFKRQIEGLIRGDDAAQKSVEGSVQTQQKLIDEAKKQDAIGAFLNSLKGAADTAGKVINYAMYITLGLFGVWGGVKLYRSLK